jgi:hypothetical protein
MGASGGLSDSYAEVCHVHSSYVGNQPPVTVQVRTPIPSVGLWSLGGEMSVQAFVPLEEPG